MIRCKHCGRSISDNAAPGLTGAIHTDGRSAGLMRCDTRDSGRFYGLCAEPEGSECVEPCTDTVRYGEGS